jgi:RNA polymerase sigma-70 factor (ECF subfamily)
MSMSFDLVSHALLSDHTATPLGARRGSDSGLITRQVIERHTPALLAFAQRMLFRAEDAEDAVQETWLSALKSAASFEGRSSLRTWLTGILRRRIFDRYHARSRLEPLLTELSSEDHDGPDPYDMQEAASYAATAIGELRDQERTAVLLCDVNEWDRDEAAEHMQITRGHLRVVLHRARNKLEQQLSVQGVTAQILAG